MNICVVALGKIGLPLAVQFAAKGHRVIGADVNEKVVELVNAGVEPFPGEHDLDVKLKQAVDAKEIVTNELIADINSGLNIKAVEAALAK